MSRGRQARAIKLSREDRKALELLTRRSSAEHRPVVRAQIALMAHTGETTAISQATDVSVQTVSHWRTRLARQGVQGLGEVARSGPGVSVPCSAWNCRPWRASAPNRSGARVRADDSGAPPERRDRRDRRWRPVWHGRRGQRALCASDAERTAMIGLPSSTRVWIVAGHTDMRKGFNGLAAMVQTAFAANPFCGHAFVFRGRRGRSSRPRPRVHSTAHGPRRRRGCPAAATR